MAVWVYFQCYESVTMQLCFLGVTSYAIKNHRNPTMYNSQPGVGTEYVARKFSIGGLWVCAGGLETLKIYKISTDL